MPIHPDDRWRATVPPPPPQARDSAEGCAGEDQADDAGALDWGGLLCAATCLVAIVSAIVLQMTGRWSGCIGWLAARFEGGQP